MTDQILQPGSPSYQPRPTEGEMFRQLYPGPEEQDRAYQACAIYARCRPAQVKVFVADPYSLHHQLFGEQTDLIKAWILTQFRQRG